MKTHQLLSSYTFIGSSPVLSGFILIGYSGARVRSHISYISMN